ncbi:Protein kinase-like domain protein [Niveomyces insectorum RCEF 264]|uniref:EKC/KEOPS complex subunit BUD32 n=1 Tax=Niveomyces insectorum RCEF 264 TaxID=1081102 RepID=A0A167LSK9_9HYPO|nr:Protein kinase-like domain protein [Niveomyces insectorum RCEF 264]
MSASHPYTYQTCAARVSPARRLQWCEDVARVLAAIHGYGIRHADLSGRNLLVDKDMNVLLCDFSGSAIDGTRAMINAEAGYRHPDKKESEFPSIRCEIHSLGSTIYEIVTAHEVYGAIPKEEVNKLIDAGQYPSLINIPLADIIGKCWSGKFTSAEEVADAVALVRRNGI